MSIRYRLILSYIAMILVPILLFLVGSFLLMILFIGDIREVSKLLPANHQYHQNEIQPDQSFYLELKKKSMQAPEEFLKSSFLASFSDRLMKLDMTLVLLKDNEIVYASEVKNIKPTQFPAFGSLTSSNNIEKLGDETYSIKQHDFYLANGSEVSLFLLKDANQVVIFTRTFFPIMFALLVLILIATNGLLTYYVSRSIIQPINRLKMAAEKIGQGYLEDALIVKGMDEISQLTRSFEHMRVQLKTSKELQRQYETNRKELIAHISHDLKTPITTIKGYVEGLRDGVANTTEKQARYLQTIYQKSKDLDRMIDELFLFSKLDLKKLQFQFTTIDLKGYLVDFVEELAFELEKRNILLSLECLQATNYNMKADSEKLKRVFSNIIENSIKYMDKDQGEIKVTLKSSNNQIFVTIEDNGQGIPKEALPYVFDQFYRADESRNQQTGGSGLGLSIAKMIIEEHGGSISAESEHRRGTTIQLVFPKEGVKL
jgi:histidine kinase